MRVAVVSESFLPTVNGVTNSVLRVLEHLDANGHQALVVAPESGDDPQSYHGARIVRVPAWSPVFLHGFQVGMPSRRMLPALRDFDPHVVHLASPFVLGAHGAHVARRIGRPAIAVYQTDIAAYSRAYGVPGAVSLSWRWVRHIHDLAARTLAPSRAAAADLRAHQIERVHLWPRGVDVDGFAPWHRDLAWRRSIGVDDDTVLVGYVGRLAPEKRIDDLRALQGLPGTRLLIVGDGPSRRALERSLPDAVFTGFLSGAELSRAHASLDVFVNPGSDETFCQAAQEALASGVPVVAAAAGGLIDLVADGVNGRLVPAHDLTALRAAVDGLVVHADARVRAGRAARTSVLGRTWSAVCTDLLRHYDDVAGTSVAPLTPARSPKAGLAA